jgi:hypothetical protein
MFKLFSRMCFSDENIGQENIRRPAGRSVNPEGLKRVFSLRRVGMTKLTYANRRKDFIVPPRPRRSTAAARAETAAPGPAPSKMTLYTPIIHPPVAARTREPRKLRPGADTPADSFAPEHSPC